MQSWLPRRTASDARNTHQTAVSCHNSDAAGSKPTVTTTTPSSAAKRGRIIAEKALPSSIISVNELLWFNLVLITILLCDTVHAGQLRFMTPWSSSNSVASYLSKHDQGTKGRCIFKHQASGINVALQWALITT